MTARSVLIDGTFLDALLDEGHLAHRQAKSLYGSLLDNYEAQRDMWFALSTVLDTFPTDVRRTALAPIATSRVARQHRSAAAKVAVLSPDVALTLVMLRRERFKAVATAVDDYDDLTIEVIKVTEVDLFDESSEDAAGLSADGFVRYETAPLPGRQHRAG